VSEDVGLKVEAVLCAADRVSREWWKRDAYSAIAMVSLASMNALDNALRELRESPREPAAQPESSPSPTGGSK
jgi:hypothetical protein